MAGFTNAAFRQIVREFGGAGLLATEMVNARGFVWLDEHEAEHPDRLWGVRGGTSTAWPSRFGTTILTTMAKVGRAACRGVSASALLTSISVVPVRGR